VWIETGGFYASNTCVERPFGGRRTGMANRRHTEQRRHQHGTGHLLWHACRFAGSAACDGAAPFNGNGRNGSASNNGANNGYGQYGGFNGQPPIIVVTAPGMLPQGQGDTHGQQAGGMGMPMWPMPAPRPARQFHVVGEREDIVEEW